MRFHLTRDAFAVSASQTETFTGRSVGLVFRFVSVGHLTIQFGARVTQNELELHSTKSMARSAAGSRFGGAPETEKCAHRASCSRYSLATVTRLAHTHDACTQSEPGMDFLTN